MNSKGLSVLFLVIAMMLMVTIGYVFSYLIPTKQKSVVFPIYSTQAFFIAQSGAEFAVRYAKDQGWTTPAQLLGLNAGAVYQRNLGAGRFTINYTNATDTLTSFGEVPIGTERRRIVVSNFTSFLYSFAYRKSITVQAGQVSNGPHTNFPMLVSMTDPNLATTANGGHVASYNAGTNDPWDIIFEALDDATCGGAGTAPCRLNHEIEAYVATTGQLVAWVRIPSINNGTVIYMYYGNSCMPSSTQNASGVWDANYRGVWHLKEDPSGTAPQMKDSTSNVNHGTSGGTMTSDDQVPGKTDGSLDFDGSNDYIAVPSSTSLKLGSGLTIEAWINVDVWGNWKDIVFKGGGAAGNSDYQFALVSTGLAWDGTLAGNWRTKYFNTTLTTGTWIHVVVTHNTTTVRMYRDGVEIGTGQSDAGAIYESDFLLAISREGAASSGYLDGKIDEVRISNIARSAGWIRTEYNNQKAPSSFYSVGLEEN